MSGRSQVTPGLVSVVVCAYNNWPDVEMTIESALHQSYQPVEVMVVDNSSTDATPQEVPRRFGHRVRYICQSNKDTAGAYNAGFAAARGEFIQFVDGDDVLAPNKIEKQVEVFRADPELDIVYGDIRIFQTSAQVATWKDFSTQKEDDMLRAMLSRPLGICTDLGMLFHRRALEKVGPWDESLYVEDTDYLLRAAWAGCRFGHCSGVPMGFARVHPDSKTANVSAMAQGVEAVLGKALGYVTREPYRSLLAAKLAQHRFYVAVSTEQMPTRQALAKLALARTTSPDTVSALAYAVGWAALFLPGGSLLVRSRWLRPIRRVLARLLHYRKPPTLCGKGRSSEVGAERGAQ